MIKALAHERGAGEAGGRGQVVLGHGVRGRASSAPETLGSPSEWSTALGAYCPLSLAAV